MRQVKAKYVVGLTATPARKDGHQPILYMQCGPIRYTLSAKDAAASHPFDHVVIPRTTEFRIADETSTPAIQDIFSALIGDGARNQLIAIDVRDAVKAGSNTSSGWRLN